MLLLLTAAVTFALTANAVTLVESRGPWQATVTFLLVLLSPPQLTVWLTLVVSLISAEKGPRLGVLVFICALALVEMSFFQMTYDVPNAFASESELLGMVTYNAVLWLAVVALVKGLGRLRARFVPSP